MERIKELAAFGANYFCLHKPSYISLEKELIIPKRNKLSKNCKIAVAGGIGLNNIEEVIKYKPEIVIIGSAITESVSPCLILKKIKEHIEKELIIKSRKRRKWSILWVILKTYFLMY